MSFQSRNILKESRSQKPGHIADLHRRPFRLLKVYCALCAGLLLVVIPQGCSWQQKAASSTPRIQTSLVQADASREPAKRPDLGDSSFDRVQTWVREDEPSLPTVPTFDLPPL